MLQNEKTNPMTSIYDLDLFIDEKQKTFQKQEE
jgi:hypothetical protein